MLFLRLQRYKILVNHESLNGEKFGTAEKKCGSFVLMSKKNRTFAAVNQPFFKPKDYEKVKFESSSISARR